jgi:hypothetical protein
MIAGVGVLQTGLGLFYAGCAILPALTEDELIQGPVRKQFCPPSTSISDSFEKVLGNAMQIRVRWKISGRIGD